MESSKQTGTIKITNKSGTLEITNLDGPLQISAEEISIGVDSISIKGKEKFSIGTDGFKGNTTVRSYPCTC